MSLIRMILGFILGWFIAGMFITKTGVFDNPAMNWLIVAVCVMGMVLSLFVEED